MSIARIPSVWKQMPDRHKERIKKRFLNCVVKPALEGEYIRSDEN